MSRIVTKIGHCRQRKWPIHVETINGQDASSSPCANALKINFAIAIRSFFQKIGDPRDIAPSMAVGFSINHIATVIDLVLGGPAWVID